MLRKRQPQLTNKKCIKQTKKMICNRYAAKFFGISYWNWLNFSNKFNEVKYVFITSVCIFH